MRFRGGWEGRRLKRKGCCQACWRRALPRFVSLEKLKSASYLNPWNPLGISNQIIKLAERAHEEICRETRPSPRPRSAKEMDNRINIEARGRGRDFFRFDLFCKRAHLRMNLSSGTLRIIRLETGK